MIVDAHTHVFPEVAGTTGRGRTRGLDAGRVSMGDEVVQLLPSGESATCFTPHRLLAEMDTAGVSGALLLQAPFYGDHDAYAASAAEAHVGRLAAAAGVDPWRRPVPEPLPAALSDPRFCAVKVEFSESTGLAGIHPGARLDDPTIEWLWEELEGHGKAAVLDLGAIGSRSYQTAAVRAVAQRHPALRIVIAHLAQPSPLVFSSESAKAQWIDQLDVGLLANVWFDMAALPAHFPEERFPWPSVGRAVTFAISRLGPDRLLWATDLPSALVWGTYLQHVEAAEQHLAGLAATDRNRVLSDNACEVFGAW